MTRYTNLGFKRKYLEAGFDAPESSTAKDNVAEKVLAEEIPAEQDATGSIEPVKKKRKRNRKKPKDASEQTQPGTDGNLDNGGEDKEAAKEAEPLSKRKMLKKQKLKDYKARMADFKSRKSASELRRQQRIKDRMADTTCFACRQKGHAIKDCPTGGGDASSGGPAASGICFRCGNKRHTLSQCRKPIPEDPANPLPFATCFVCKASGHLASTCTSSKSRGVYPNGGCCKVCGETSHLAKDCVIRRTDKQKDGILIGHGRNAGADEDDFHVVSRGRRDADHEEEDDKPRGKIKRLVGGKIIIRVDDELAKPAAPRPLLPMAKVKTVVF